MGKLDEAKVRERAVTTSAASAPEGPSAADSATDRATEQHRHITSNLLHLYDLTDSSKVRTPTCPRSHSLSSPLRCTTMPALNVGDAKTFMVVQIVPHCEKLLERLHKLEDVLPKYQGVTGQLYELLRCTRLDEIVPLVRRLTSGGDDAE